MEHSRKPDEIHRRIERLYPDAAKLEMFARRPMDGWDVWGNEV
jgi:N6-adenosine-specific RNA methylase IME4